MCPLTGSTSLLQMYLLLENKSFLFGYASLIPKLRPGSVGSGNKRYTDNANYYSSTRVAQNISTVYISMFTELARKQTRSNINALIVQTSNSQGRMSLNLFFFLLAGSWPASAG